METHAWDNTKRAMDASMAPVRLVAADPAENYRGFFRAVRSKPQALVVSLLVATGGISHADTMVFNTDTGLVTVNGAVVSTLNGTPFSTALDSGTGIRHWYFSGDLNINAGDIVKGVGAYGASLVAGNNAYVAPGASFDISAGGGRRGIAGTIANGGTGGFRQEEHEPDIGDPADDYVPGYGLGGSGGFRGLGGVAGANLGWSTAGSDGWAGWGGMQGAP
ncbi:MAG: hypothetical protein HKO62_08965, partial [Gammaproteobacteria bacterium]|nr:hypothetical protein [Gammaproteobacteria bacterium]